MFSRNRDPSPTFSNITCIFLVILQTSPSAINSQQIQIKNDLYKIKACLTWVLFCHIHDKTSLI